MTHPDEETIQDLGTSLSRTMACASLYTRHYAAPSIRNASQHLYDMFTEHPHSQRMTYCQHLTRAASIALRMGGGAIAAAVHSVFPFCFTHTSSHVIHDLHMEQIDHNVSLEEHDKAERFAARYAGDRRKLE